MSFKLSGGSPTVEVSASASINNSYSNTQAQVTVTANSWMVYSGSWVQSSGVVAKATGNGSSLGTKTIFGNGTRTEGTSVHSVTFTFLVNKGTSAKNVSWSVDFHSYIDGTDLGCKATKSGTVSVSAKPSYTVSYNANGGDGAPGNQTKWYGTTLALSSTKPTRTGYSFKNWNTKSDGTGTSYASGANYTGNAALTLYAQWTANTYTISYNANGGSGAPSAQTKTYGVTLKLSSTKPTRTNYNFLGWGTSASATTVAYAAGANYTVNSAATLYAIWELAYWKPKITNFTVSRCTSNGTADEYGTYAKVVFDWELCQLLGTNTAPTITIDWGSSSNVTASGASGTVSQVVGAGAINVNSAYTFTVKVQDNRDSTSISKTLGSSAFPIDVLAGGTGVAFGKAADYEGLDCAYPAKFTYSSHPQILIEHGVENKGSYIRARRSDTGASIQFGVSSDGETKGIYDINNERWMLYMDSTYPLYTRMNRLHITGTTDASGTADNNAPLIIGDRSGVHLVIDGNEIQRKASGTTVGTLALNPDGGSVTVRGGNIYGAVQLYNNTSGSASTITLSSSAANYTYLEIFYCNNNGQEPQSIRVYNPNGQNISLYSIEPSETNIFFRTTHYIISGTSIKPHGTALGYYAVQINTLSGHHSWGTNYIRILRVIGYK